MFLRTFKTFYRKIYFDIFFDEKKIIKKPDILFSSYYESWRKFLHKSGESYKDDVMIGGVIEKAKDEFENILCIDQNAILKNAEAAREKNSNKYKEWCCIEAFVSYRDIFLSLFLSLKKILGRKIYDEYEKFIHIINPDIFYYKIFNLLTSERIVKKVKPKSIFLTCEYCSFHREFTYIAKQNNILVFALQHGVIHPEHKAYIFKDKDIRSILPDITFVYGEYHKKLLCNESVYKPSEVVITGQPRYDILYYADKIYSKNDFKKSYNIPSNHKIVLWTTQSHASIVDDEENLLNFETVFNSIRKMKNITLIVKQHPNEPEKYTQMIKKTQQMFDVDILLVPKNSDTFEQLYACDVMITRDSTTALEAIALDKPVLILNISDRPDRVDYVEQGIELGVYKPEDFKPTLEKLLKDDTGLAKNRDDYIEKYLYRIDGKSTERVINSIKDIISN
ncbi:MAG: UDP-N-acetylglucosamine 2-epimerase [Candidatus Thermoplasmatota archaeon]